MTDKDQILAKKTRTVALVIAFSMVLWMILQMIAPLVGLGGRYAFLFDLAALAALIWAFVNIFQIWRARRSAEG